MYVLKGDNRAAIWISFIMKTSKREKIPQHSVEF